MKQTAGVRIASLVLLGLLAVFTLGVYADAPSYGLVGGHAVDYLHLDAAAHLLRQHGCLYCYNQIRSEEIHLLGYVPRTSPYFPNEFLDLPVVALLMVPLSFLTFASSERVFVLLMELVVLVDGWLIFRMLPKDWSNAKRLAILLLSAFMFPGTIDVFLGKYEPVLCLGLILGFMYNRRKPFVSGLLFAIAALEPQLLIFLPVAMLLSRQWKTLLGFVSGSAVWLLASLVVLHGNVAPYISLLISNSHLSPIHEPSIPEYIGAIGGTDLAFVLSVAGPLVTAAAFWLRRSALVANPRLGYAVALVASIAWSTHAGEYDLLLLAAPIAIWSMYDYVPALVFAACLSAAYAIGLYGHAVTPLEPLVLVIPLLWWWRHTSSTVPHEGAAIRTGELAS